MTVNDDLKFSIFHLRQHVLSIGIGIESMTELKLLRPHFSTNHKWLHLMGVSQSFIINKIDNLFEEYEDHFAKEVDDIEFLRALKILLKEVKTIAPDYNKFRNEVGAHSLRKKKDSGKGKESIFKGGLLAPTANPYRIPNSDEEFLNLRIACDKFMSAIYEMFPEVLKEIETRKFP
jgi:hypothetical protein